MAATSDVVLLLFISRFLTKSKEGFFLNHLPKRGSKAPKILGGKIKEAEKTLKNEINKREMKKTRYNDWHCI